MWSKRLLSWERSRLCRAGRSGLERSCPFLSFFFLVDGTSRDLTRRELRAFFKTNQGKGGICYS